MYLIICFAKLSYLNLLLEAVVDATVKNRGTNTLLGIVDPLDVDSLGHWSVATNHRLPTWLTQTWLLANLHVISQLLLLLLFLLFLLMQCSYFCFPSGISINACACASPLCFIKTTPIPPRFSLLDLSSHFLFCHLSYFNLFLYFFHFYHFINQILFIPNT